MHPIVSEHEDCVDDGSHEHDDAANSEADAPVGVAAGRGKRTGARQAAANRAADPPA
jgi:hypothetical protein